MPIVDTAPAAEPTIDPKQTPTVLPVSTTAPSEVKLNCHAQATLCTTINVVADKKILTEIYKK